MAPELNRNTNPNEPVEEAPTLSALAALVADLAGVTQQRLREVRGRFSIGPYLLQQGDQVGKRVAVILSVEDLNIGQGANLPINTWFTPGVRGIGSTSN